MRRLYGDIEMITTYPQFFTDLGIRMYPFRTGIRSAQKNVDASMHLFFSHQCPTPLIGVRYDPPDLHQGVSVFESMERLSGVRLKSIAMDLPDFGPSHIPGDYIVARIATTRTDWISYSRNPLPEYIAQAVAMARADGFKIVLVGDVVPGYEEALEPVPEADVVYLRGELNTDRLMALVAGAKGIIAPIGWVVPASLAFDVPLLAIVGGQLANNHPKVLTDTRLMRNRITWAMPDRPCPCGDVTHNCERTISDLADHYRRFLRSVSGHVDQGPHLAARGVDGLLQGGHAGAL